jgi:hypothetical protein
MSAAAAEVCVDLLATIDTQLMKAGQYVGQHSSAQHSSLKQAAGRVLSVAKPTHQFQLHKRICNRVTGNWLIIAN